MKYSKRYVIFIVLSILLFMGRFQLFGEDAGTIKNFRGGELDPEVWNPLIAQEVNSTTPSVAIDHKEYKGEAIGCYMDGKRNIMVPVSILRDALNCSVHVYKSKKLIVEKHNLSATLQLDKLTAKDKEGNKVKLASGLVRENGQLYVSLNDISDLLGYHWAFDYDNNIMITADTSESSSVVPTSYDLRDRGRVSVIRNQGSYGTCWAFAATGAMESALLPEQKAVFSVDHMSMSNSFDVTQYDGGEYTMGMAYLAAWQGPVYEEDDPYGDNRTDGRLKPVAHVQQMRIIDGKDFDGIKTAVFKYGGVQTSLYSTLSSSSGSSNYYNSRTCSYCYMGTEKPNHDVIIIGWDDNYPKENFSVELEGDGAFICQNSWGESFGEDGVFYVSYYDTNIGTHNVVYTSIEPVDNYDHIYQSDLCGWIGKMGYDKEDIFGANAFVAQGNETVTAASFYATGADTEYHFFVVKDFKDISSFQNMQETASGVVDRAGYYTIDFDMPVEVKAGEKYAVVLYVKTPGATHPLAIEYDSGDDYLDNLDLDDGEGYISYNGSKFINVKDKQDCNLCIKAFTDDR